MGYHDFLRASCGGDGFCKKGLPTSVQKGPCRQKFCEGPSLFTLGLSRSIISSMPCHLQAICTWILGTDRLLARPSSHFE